jgi:hypothetical protein
MSGDARHCHPAVSSNRRRVCKACHPHPDVRDRGTIDVRVQPSWPAPNHISPYPSLYTQWLGNLVNFGQDLRRTTGVPPSYDMSIAALITDVLDDSGNVKQIGFHFSGTSIGSDSVTVTGGNWNDQTSPASVQLTWETCLAAAGVSRCMLLKDAAL